jgi:hypothetical protein
LISSRRWPPPRCVIHSSCARILSGAPNACCGTPTPCMSELTESLAAAAESSVISSPCMSLESGEECGLPVRNDVCVYLRAVPRYISRYKMCMARRHHKTSRRHHPAGRHLAVCALVLHASKAYSTVMTRHSGRVVSVSGTCRTLATCSHQCALC